MAELIATVSHIFANMPIVHFAQDGENFQDLTWRVFLGHNEVNVPSEGEEKLEKIGAWSKVATAALRIPIFTDGKGWSEGNEGHDPDKEPDTRKRNPVIAKFVKAHNRLPSGGTKGRDDGDTITLTSASEIFVPTTFEPNGNKQLTGKYSAPMAAVLTEEQWEAIPDIQKNRQNCIFELLNTTGISIVATEKAGQAPEQPVSSGLEKGW